MEIAQHPGPRAFGCRREGIAPQRAKGLAGLRVEVRGVVDDETQQKIDVVKQRLIKYFGYNETSATDVLNYVASIFARGDSKQDD